MSNIIDNILFNDYGLDTDSDYRHMSKGSAPYALNILKNEDGAGYIITNLKGNKKITYYPPAKHPLLNCNVYFTLCSCYDPLTRNVYYWVFTQPIDSTGSEEYLYDNRLLRFNEDSEDIDTIFVDYYNYFGLDPTKPFKDSFVLGDWLYFNPRESEPKMIHIDMAYNYTNYDAYDSTLTYIFGQKVTYYGGLFSALEAVAVGESPELSSTKWDRIDDAYQDEAGDADYDSEFHYAFNVIKRIPLYRPLCFYGRNEDVIANNVKNLVGRFAYRYKYFDNSYSLYSAYSDVTLPRNSEYYNGDVDDDSTLCNYIGVRVILHSAALVKEIEIVYQEIGGDWRKVKTINRRDIELLSTSEYYYYFYNDGAYPEIDDARIDIPQDSVPQKANCQEIINKNILTYAGCTEGFANVPKEEIEVTLTAQIEALAVPNSEDVIKHDNKKPVYVVSQPFQGDWTSIIRRGSGPTEIYYLLKISSWFAVAGLAANDVYTVICNNISKDYTILAGDAANVNVLIGHLVTFYNTEYPHFNSTVDTYTLHDGTICIRFYQLPLITKSVFYTPGAAETKLTKFRGFKTGSWHPFCIFYYDENFRRWEAQTAKENNVVTDAAWTIEGTTAYVPMLNEYSPAGDTTAYKFNIQWEVNHLPPEGAKYWRWGYAGNALCSYFVQYVIAGIGASTGDEPDGTLYVDITPLQTIKTTTAASYYQFPNSNIDAYVYEAGDRIRFITEAAGADMGLLVNGIYDMEILKYDATTNRIYVQSQGFDYAGHGIGVKSLVEIYKPLKTDTQYRFYEFGEVMPIIEDSGGVLVHGVSTLGTLDQDFALDQPATGVFYAGDIYHILRTPSYYISTTESYFHESMWYSDFYSSSDWDRGKTGFETNFGQRYLNIVRYSNQYLQNTLINGLSTFEGNNYIELNDIYGDILRIIENGDTLKVYQRKKPSSLMIGRTQYYDSEGNANVSVLSDRILSQPRYSTTNYGTEYPESISRNNRYVYGFDVYNGVMWRDSANGIFPISGRYEALDGGGDYKMETWFKQKAKDLLVSGVNHTTVMTTWDERHKNLYVIFKDTLDYNNDTAIMFHEPSNKWICFTDMGYTPSEGWDEILELDFTVIRGFEGGLDYEFDEDTRFTVFTLQSSSAPDDYVPSGTFIVDEDGVTYLVNDDGEFIIDG